jgi:hypothetical protein
MSKRLYTIVAVASFAGLVSCPDTRSAKSPHFKPNPPYPPAPVSPYGPQSDIAPPPVPEEEEAPRPPSPPPVSQLPPVSEPTPEVAAPQTTDNYPTARRTSRLNEVTSPYPPYNVINVEGYKSKQLVRDPDTKQIFRVP